MKIENKIASACQALNRLESSGRKITTHRRRRCAYWLGVHSQLVWKSQREFRAELGGSLVAAMRSGKIQKLIGLG